MVTRPLRLMALTGLLALFQMTAAWRALSLPAALVPLVQLPPVLDIVGGTLWGLLFAWITLNLIRLGEKIRRIANRTIMGFLVYSLLRLLLFAQADYDRQRLPFLLILTILILVFPVARWIRPSTNGDHT